MKTISWAIGGRGPRGPPPSKYAHGYYKVKIVHWRPILSIAQQYLKPNRGNFGTEITDTLRVTR